MKYVVNTPPIYGNTDKIYGIEGSLYNYKLEELQAIVELWSQYYGAITGEWKQGAVSTDTFWNFMAQDFGKGVFLDYDRMYSLCYTKLPRDMGGYTIDATSCALWQDFDPLSYYPSGLYGDNIFFDNVEQDGYDGDFLASANTFNQQLLDFYYYSRQSQTIVSPLVLPIADICGTHPFAPNAATLKKDMVQIWQNLKNVASHDLYLLTPSSGTHMFSQGSGTEPFSRAKYSGTNYSSSSIRQHVNESPAPAPVVGQVRYGYDTDSFTVKESFDYGQRTYYDDGTSDPTDFHHLEWNREVFSLNNTSGDNYLYKMVPVPMEAFAHPDDDPDDPFVPQSRSLLIVWRVELDVRYKRNITGEVILPTTVKHYVSRFDFTKGNYHPSWSDYENNYYGQVIEWKMPWDIFADTIDEIKTDMGWTTP